MLNSVSEPVLVGTASLHALKCCAIQGLFAEYYAMLSSTAIYRSDSDIGVSNTDLST